MVYNKKAYNVKPYHKDEIRLDKELKDTKGPFFPTNEKNVDEKLERPISFSHIGKTVGESGKQDILGGFKTAIRQGASKVELSIGSTSLGSSSGIGYHGPKKRKAIKEMSIASNVKINSVHTPPTGGEAVANLSGFNPKEGMNKEIVEKSKETIKRTIDFAYDVTSDNEDQIPDEGISVVVHTGEFPRSMKEVNKRYEGRNNFNVEDKPKHFFVDTENEKTSAISEEDEIVFSNKQLEGYKDLNENDPLYKFKGLYEILDEIKDESNGFTKIKWEDFEENEDNEKESLVERLNKKIKEDDTLKKSLIGDDEDEELTATETFVKMNFFFNGILKAQKQIAQSERMKNEAKFRGKSDDYKESLIKEAEISKVDAELQLKEIEKRMKKIKDIEKVAKKNTVDSYVELAEHIYDRQKQEGTKKNVHLAPENIFPEQGYGSHPDELIELIKESREKFKDKLIEKEGLNEESARKIAEDKIKATFDTQHLALWGKHFKGSEEEFWDWYDEKVEEMSKEGIIGNVHMVDGDRYSHGHQPIGHGKIPIRKAMSKIKKYYEKNGMSLPAMNSEGWDTPGKPGSGEQLTSAWRELSSFKDSYIPKKRRNVNFSEIEDSYFMGKKSPYFVYGNNSPSKLFTSWSGLPLE